MDLSPKMLQTPRLSPHFGARDDAPSALSYNGQWRNWHTIGADFRNSNHFRIRGRRYGNG